MIAAALSCEPARTTTAPSTMTVPAATATLTISPRLGDRLVED
jgi:hypothetical protein